MQTPDLKMQEILGFLFLLCVTVVSLRLAVVKALDWKSLSSLLIFGLFAGFVVARYDSIKGFKFSKEAGVELYQQQIDAITSGAIAEVSREVTAQKESLRLVIADANVTREKVDEQTSVLRELYEKTKVVEQNLEIQGQELDQTIQRSATIERNLKAANEILTDLKNGTAQAEEKLALLDDKTNGIIPLPDGRLKIGQLVAGSPVILERKGKELFDAFAAQDTKNGYTLAVETIKVFEDTEKQSEDAGVTAGGINPVWIARVYSIGSDFARIEGHHASAVDWAKKSIARNNSGVSRAVLVMALLTASDREAAQKIIDETLSLDAALVTEFRETLTRVGITLE